MTELNQITLTRPDDWHLHLRDGAALAAVLPHTARQFGRAIVMPNLKPPVITVADAAAYRQRILTALPAGLSFEPLMTLYLTDTTPVVEIAKAVDSGFVKAVKLFPAGATTNSDSGVTSIEKTYAVLAEMEKLGLPLLVHGEETDPAIDIFDREAAFIERTLEPLLKRFPGLKVVMEHITTADAADFVKSAGAQLAATVTAHHLLLNRNAMFTGGLRPYHYCLPVLKAEKHRQAVVATATSGNPKFFLGTDSAPHPRSAKETAIAAGGCFSAFAALELYAQIFEQAGALEKLEAFASFYGADFYGLPRNTSKITLKKETWQIPASLPYLDNDPVVPLFAGETICWKMS
ncbi:MAG: dihydroorotase, homodimeric type [Proteobacteria bacterium]|nr:dihydroorotase, homodimeric type [Pseudomonadota bacterium]